MEIVKKVMGIILLLVSVRYGVMAMAFSLLVNSVVSQIINAWPSKSLIDYGFIEQLKDIIPTVVLTFIMALAISSVGFIQLSMFMKMIVKILLGFIVYVLGSYIMKNEIFIYLLNMIKSFLKK